MMFVSFVNCLWNLFAVALWVICVKCTDRVKRVALARHVSAPVPPCSLYSRHTATNRPACKCQGFQSHFYILITAGQLSSMNSAPTEQVGAFSVESLGLLVKMGDLGPGARAAPIFTHAGRHRPTSVLVSTGAVGYGQGVW